MECDCAMWREKCMGRNIAAFVGWCNTCVHVCYKIIDLTIGLRVKEEEEREGLGTATHGERAYNM